MYKILIVPQSQGNTRHQTKIQPAFYIFICLSTTVTKCTIYVLDSDFTPAPWESLLRFIVMDLMSQNASKHITCFVTSYIPCKEPGLSRKLITSHTITYKSHRHMSLGGLLVHLSTVVRQRHMVSMWK